MIPDTRLELECTQCHFNTFENSKQKCCLCGAEMRVVQEFMRD